MERLQNYPNALQNFPGTSEKPLGPALAIFRTTPGARCEPMSVDPSASQRPPELHPPRAPSILKSSVPGDLQTLTPPRCHALPEGCQRHWSSLAASTRLLPSSLPPFLEPLPPCLLPPSLASNHFHPACSHPLFIAEAACVELASLGAYQLLAGAFDAVPLLQQFLHLSLRSSSIHWHTLQWSTQVLWDFAT